MAQVIRYVDPDAAGAGTGVDWANAYTSLSAWEAAEQTDLVTDGDYHTVYCRSSGGTNDTSSCNISGWTTGPANYIEIIGNDFPSSGIYDGTKYVLESNSSLGALSLSLGADYVRIINLQILVPQTGTTTRTGIYISGPTTTDIRIDSCIIKGQCSGTGTAYGLFCTDGSVDLNIYNTLVYDFVSGTDTGFKGLYISCNTAGIYNCTVYNCYGAGIQRAGGTVTVKNCAVGLSNDHFLGTMTIDYCCSDTGEGTNAQTPSGGSWANEFSNAAGGDFRLKVGGNCVNNGTDNPGSGLYSDDIRGTARS